MNKRQKIVQERFLNNEEAVIKRLEKVYNQSLKDVTAKSEKLYKEIEELTAVYDNIEDEAEKAVLKSRIQSKVYQKQYQDSLKKQISDILDDMHEKSYTTVADYLNQCYEDGFVGALYDIQGQGIPLAFPLDQESMVRAVQLDSKISSGLYNHLGEDVSKLKKHITAQVSRGISSGMTFKQIAQQLATKMTGQYKNPGGSLSYATRIARTEGHRIQCQAGMDACYKAKEKGADVVKQWDATLDGKTRTSHINVDGQIRELDEKFSNGLMFPGDPSGGAAEVCNCRCALHQRARWALDSGFTKMNNFTKQLETFDSPEDYAEFKKSFFSKENKKYMDHVQKMEEKYGTRDFQKVLGGMNTREYNHYSKLLESNPVFNKDFAMVDAQKLDINNFPASFLADGERENTQRFVDYINGLEGANPDTVKLYNSMGQLESVESNGIAFKITHGSKHSVQANFEDWSGELKEVELAIPKLTDKNIEARINTTLHEEMHLMDLYLREDKDYYDDWFSSRSKKFAVALKKTDDSISIEMQGIFDAYHRECTRISSTVSTKYREMKETLRKSYYPDGIDWHDAKKYKKYKKEVDKLIRLEIEEEELLCRSCCGGGVSNLEDIYDALSHGKYRDESVVRYGHGSKYYANPEKIAEEILADYGALSVTRPDLIEMLRKDKPELVAELESIVKAMLKEAGV